MGLAHEKKSYLQEKANLFEIGSLDQHLKNNGNSGIIYLKNRKYIWKTVKS